MDEFDVVIVGAGAAGHATATTLRKEGFDGRVAVVHGEDGPAYRRTLVDKALVQGLLTVDQAALTSLDEVELVRDRAVSLDPARLAVRLGTGRELRGSRIVVATGASPRPQSPRTPGRRVAQVHTAADAARLREMVGPSPAENVITVLGAGFIGSEVAAWLAGAGATVHLVARSKLPLAQSLGTVVAGEVARLHREHLTAHYGRTVETVVDARSGPVVRLDDGRSLESDLVVVAHGTTPAAAWADPQISAVTVDDRLRDLTRSGLYAAGSAAIHRDRHGDTYRVDHWDAAEAQGRHAALTLLHDLTGSPDPGPYLPDSGFTLTLYRTQIAGYGAPVPGAQQEHHMLDGGGTLTRFRTPDAGLIAVTGIGAMRELYAMRHDLQRA